MCFRTPVSLSLKRRGNEQEGARGTMKRHRLSSGMPEGVGPWSAVWKGNETLSQMCANTMMSLLLGRDKEQRGAGGQ